MKRILLLALLFLAVGSLRSQEMDCMVTVSAQQVEGSDKHVFETMQTALYEFVNNRKWTNYNVKLDERIQCTILITVNERPASDEFHATLNLVLRRPVFNTSYNSILLNYVDKDFEFKYVEYEPLNYSDGTFDSNLTSTIAYYIYVYLGLYFDSFSPEGGTQFYQKAQDIVNLAQGTSEKGWKAYEGLKNRYWLIENLLTASNGPMRDFFYKYHRLGLDQMYDKQEAGRAQITESIGLLNKMYDAKPGLLLLQVTLDAKKDEIVNIYSDSRVPPTEKNDVVNILKEIDPANASKYLTILDNK